MSEDRRGSGRIENGIEEAGAYLAPLSKDASPAADDLSNSGNPEPLSSSASGSSSPALDFLDDFFGRDKRHLVAIKKRNGKNEIKAEHFDAADREGQRAFITDNGKAEFDLYFTPNPVRGTLHKKASKNDIVEAHHLWVDLDPRKTEPLEAERAAMLALLTTDLPNGLPRPNRVIDSGRGLWGYWKLDKPAPVDGSQNNVNGPLTETVERYGRSIEQAFGAHFADGCRNIDRIARLPGTVNTKTGRLASVLQEFSHDAAHAIESFPQRDQFDEQRDQQAGHFNPSDNYDPIDPTDPLLANLPAKWLEMLQADDYAAAYSGDRSRAEMAFATAAMRAGVNERTIARCLMDKRRSFGGNTRASDRLLIRVIEKAKQYADDPVLEQMNREFAAGFIGNKFRIAKFDRHLRYPTSQRKVEFLSKDDFVNGVVNPRVDVTKFNQNGKEDGTKPTPRGAYWFGLAGRSEFDAVTFKPAAPPIIEVEARRRYPSYN